MEIHTATYWVQNAIFFTPIEGTDDVFLLNVDRCASWKSKKTMEIKNCDERHLSSVVYWRARIFRLSIC